jgi:hypothetical protein
MQISPRRRPFLTAKRRNRAQADSIGRKQNVQDWNRAGIGVSLTNLAVATAIRSFDPFHEVLSEKVTATCST